RHHECGPEAARQPAQRPSPPSHARRWERLARIAQTLGPELGVARLDVGKPPIHRRKRLVLLGVRDQPVQLRAVELVLEIRSPPSPDARAGGGVLFAGLAAPFMLGALMICAGLIVGGTVGFVLAFGAFLLLVAGVAVGIWAWIRTDDDH